MAKDKSWRVYKSERAEALCHACSMLEVLNQNREFYIDFCDGEERGALGRLWKRLIHVIIQENLEKVDPLENVE